MRRFERALPNALWQIDIFTFELKRMYRVYLVGQGQTPQHGHRAAGGSWLLGTTRWSVISPSSTVTRFTVLEPMSRPMILIASAPAIL